MKREAYYQGTKDPDKKQKSDKLPGNRLDMDIRPHVLFRNYDYTSDPKENETSPGGGLYHGPMDRFKSVKDFLSKKKRKSKVSFRIEALVRLAKEVGVEL